MEQEKLSDWQKRIEKKLDLVLVMRSEFELMKKIFAGLFIGLVTYLGFKK